MEKNKERLIETLTRGRNSAKGLQNLLRRELNVDSAVPVEDLLMEILGSFSGGLSILNSSDSGEIRGVPASPYAGLATSVDQRPKVYSGKKPAPGVKERRGCYKRRRTIDSTIKISGTTEDGYAWRKYGQKEILNSKFPRCYYRCTHKPVHGCKAQKQVQKLEDESKVTLFHITYIGHHTCPTNTTFSHDHQSQLVLDFEDSKVTHHHRFSNSPSSNGPSTSSVKQEDVDSKAQSTDGVSSDNVSSANDGALSASSTALRWNDVLMGDDMVACHVAEAGASIMGFDYEDSCASADTSSHGYFINMDYLNNGDDLLSDINLLDDVFS